MKNIAHWLIEFISSVLIVFVIFTPVMLDSEAEPYLKIFVLLSFSLVLTLVFHFIGVLKRRFVKQAPVPVIGNEEFNIAMNSNYLFNIVLFNISLLCFFIAGPFLLVLIPGANSWGIAGVFFGIIAQAAFISLAIYSLWHVVTKLLLRRRIIIVNKKDFLKFVTAIILFILSLIFIPVFSLYIYLGYCILFFIFISFMNNRAREVDKNVVIKTPIFFRILFWISLVSAGIVILYLFYSFRK